MYPWDQKVASLGNLSIAHVKVWHTYDLIQELFCGILQGVHVGQFSSGVGVADENDGLSTAWLVVLEGDG